MLGRYQGVPDQHSMTVVASDGDLPFAAPTTNDSNAQEAVTAKLRTLVAHRDVTGSEPTLMLDVANVWCPALAKSF
jgi:hypothetical protein